MHKAIKRTALALALGFGLVGGASAALQTIDGLHTTFTFDDSMLGLYGTPSVVGDTLFFTPTSFVASSSDGTGLGYKNATINVEIGAKAGYVLSGIDLSEAGDYLLYQPVANGGALGVDLTGQIRVRDLNNLAEVTSNIASSGPLTQVGLPTHNWSADADTSFANASAVNLTIENILLAYTTSAPSLAFIEKKFVGAEVQVMAVPEPDSYAMLLAGLGVLGMIVRRRRQA